MAATATINQGTQQLSVSSDCLPSPVNSGTFPNDNNANTIVTHDWDHSFLYRGGTFGTSRVFDDNTWTQDGFIRSINISVTDLNNFTGVQPNIQPGDEVCFNFGDIKRKYIFRGTTFTSIDGEFWLATDSRIDIIMADTNTGANGTYTYHDQRNGRDATPLGAIGISGNGVPIFNPSAGPNGNPPAGFNWVSAGISAQSFINFGEDTCGGKTQEQGMYHYHDSDFLSCWKSNSSMASYNDYYGSTQFNGNNIRHPDGHSKIVGIAFDGFPIYGPYAYDHSWDSLSGTRVMRTGYSVKSTEAPGRPDYGNDSDNPPAGSLMQDWEYVEATGDLDRHNGRFCVTPEYPNGTYAYFLTVDQTDVSVVKFPFIMGLETRETINTPTNNGSNPVQDSGDSGDGGGAAPSTLQIALQPQNVTVNANQTATFTINSQILPENGPMTYQWYRSTDGGYAFAAVTGATTNTYAVTALAYMTGYRYRCRITGPVGGTAAQNSPLDSQNAILTVTGSGDGGSLANRFDSTQSTMDSTQQTFDGT
tara:strand:- start:7287 stop:8885 length:1599 start_codon:yes stop_codon:yes gene_type:complete